MKARILVLGVLLIGLTTMVSAQDCPPIACIHDPCPGNHIPNEDGCISCASPCATEKCESLGGRCVYMGWIDKFTNWVGIHRCPAGYDPLGYGACSYGNHVCCVPTSKQCEKVGGYCTPLTFCTTNTYCPTNCRPGYHLDPSYSCYFLHTECAPGSTDCVLPMVTCCVPDIIPTTTTTIVTKTCATNDECRWCGDQCVSTQYTGLCTAVIPPIGVYCQCVNGNCQKIPVGPTTTTTTTIGPAQCTTTEAEVTVVGSKFCIPSDLVNSLRDIVRAIGREIF